MGVALAFGRRAIPALARGGMALGRKLLPKAVKHLPRSVLSSAVQAVGEDILKKELRKRAANRYGFLGSIRYAAAEKLMEQQKHAEKTRLRMQRKEDAAIALKRANRMQKLKRSKQDAQRQLHVTRALTRRRRAMGLPSA